MPNQVTAYCRSVRQGERGLSTARPTARIGARIRVDQERATRSRWWAAAMACGSRANSVVAGGFVARRERVACFRGPHEAGDRHLPMRQALGRRAGSRRSVGTKPRLTITTAPLASFMGVSR